MLLLSFIGEAAAAKKNGASPQPIISRISIRNTDIFDMESNPSLNHFPYNTINFLHIKTREHVIRQEILLKEGERYDPFLASETERNLRALSFIRSARVARFPQRDGTVAVVVHANDSWTTEPQINLGGQNKIDSTEVGFKEKNLLGLGKTVGIFYKQGDDFIQREYDYSDPRLFGTRLKLDAEYLTETEGEERNVKLEQPFYSADSKFSARASHNRLDSILDEFENNRQVSRYAQSKETTESYAGVKVGGGRDVVNHLGLRYRRILSNYERIDQTAAGRDIPADNKTQAFFLDFDAGKSDFVELTRLEKMTRVEDLNLGPSIRLSPGILPEALNGREDQYESEVSFERKSLIRNQHLFSRRYTYGGRDTFNHGENQKYGVMWKFYGRPNDFHTVVFHTRIDWGTRLDPDNKVKLGGENGLRAFEDDEIVGDKGLLLNLEDRLFFVDEVFNLFSIGGVVYYDTGYVWPDGRPIALSKLRSDVGAGIRLGLTRSSNEVIIRFDFSYRTQVDNPGDSHMVVTFGTGQAF